jgi:hypothetical protein
MDAPIDRTECLKTIWCWTLGTASLRACRRTMNIDCPSPHGHARLTVTRAYRCAARPRGGNAVRRNRHRSRVPCRATDHAGSAVERRLTLRVTLQESPIELHESPVDEPYTSAVMLTESQAPLPQHSPARRPLGRSIRTVRATRVQHHSPSPTSMNGDLAKHAGGARRSRPLRQNGKLSQRTVELVLHVCCTRAKLIMSARDRAAPGRSRMPVILGVPTLQSKIIKGSEHNTFGSVVTMSTK